MKEFFFYNWDRRPIMNWSNFFKYDTGKQDTVCFDVEVSKTIFEVFTTVKTNLIDLMTFREDLTSLYGQTLQKAIYVSCDEVLRIELIREKSGRVCQIFCVYDPKMKSNLKVNDYFDQTFLLKLENSINDFLTSIV